MREGREKGFQNPNPVKSVKLQPQTLSQFTARQQTRVDRICTLEAFALFLSVKF